MADNISKDICDLIESALDEKIENFEIKEHESNEKGQGYLGEMFFVSLKNKKTGEDHHLVVKQVLSSTQESTTDFMSSSYNSEIRFYKKFIPSLRDFQKSYPGVEIFHNVPKCVAASAERGKEKIVLENLKFKNYELHSKHIPVDDKKFEAIFKLYGKYHGLCLAFKNQQPETFMELASGFESNFKKLVDQGLMARGVSGVCQMVKGFLEEANEVKIAEKFKKYVDNGVKAYVDAITYRSPLSVLVHGDCHSNNMMFKYNKSGDVEDIKMLDFQMSTLGTPILDLTYSFYSGASKDTLDKLDHFLKIYHKSVSETLKQYDCDVDKILPLEDLKKEWKEYCAFGFLMGLLLWMTKSLEASQLKSMPNLSEIMEDKTDASMSSMATINNDFFKKSTLDLVRHLYENDFL